MGIATVAVYSEPDRDALFVAEADEAVPLGGATSAESYLRSDALLEAARRTGCDAVHPGYGFLAENAEFAQACANAGFTFIGPSPEAIAAMGSKIEAKRRMREAGVPVLDGFDVTDQSADQLVKQAEKLGWPVLIKASAGGGGKGMRIVRQASDLPAALEAARTESQSAFGDATVFLEPYVETSRHVEIQIFGDTQGNVVHLFERECSIQRRHQKILEEAPSVAVDEELRQAMGQAAVEAGRAIGYVGAGTVEFLLSPQGDFHFLEVNTRLQVEHPVTECITGLDLVRLQLLVAQGEPLPEEAHAPSISGHAIEVRLYAEDPRQDFMPGTGTLHCFEVPDSPGLRLESGVVTGDVVSPYYDPMLAKLILHAPTRGEAARRLADVLARTQLHGLKTNRELLVRLLRHPEFLAGKTDTHFLPRHDPVQLGAPLSDDATRRLHAVAAAVSAQAKNRESAAVLARLPSGWRNNPSQYQLASFHAEEEDLAVYYRFERDGLKVHFGEEAELEPVTLHQATHQSVEMTMRGVRRRYRIQRIGQTVYVDSPLGCSEFQWVSRFPTADELEATGSLVAPLPGVVAEVKAQVGDSVQLGQTLLVIESMKMLHPVNAPVEGRLAELRVSAADQVDAGTVLAVIESDETPV
jgi:acetyl/propionyl-CoA carboxylase alpha subunit